MTNPTCTLNISPTSRRGAALARTAAGLACMALLYGCAGLEQAAGKLGIKVERTPVAPGAAAAAGPQATPSAAAAVPNPIRRTELDGIFKKNPITNSKRPETFPRVALTIKSATEGVFKYGGPSALLATDCVTFDIRLWTDAKSSKRFDNLRMCTDGVAEVATGVPVRTLTLIPRFAQHPGLETTAAQRTEGPVPPFHVFPQDIRSQHTWAGTNQNAIYFLGAILLSLGYDWDNDFDRRLWVVSVPLDVQGTTGAK